jgi:hypothetical protein
MTSHCIQLLPMLIYVASCSLHFKPVLSIMAETELKCNTGFREHITLAFYHIRQLMLSPFYY